MQPEKRAVFFLGGGRGISLASSHAAGVAVAAGKRACSAVAAAAVYDQGPGWVGGGEVEYHGVMLFCPPEVRGFIPW